MYLVHRLRQIYESYSPGSIESSIAKYLLLNLNDIEALTLTDISKCTSISKSAVSNFISELSYDNGFSLFKNTLIRDINQIIVEKNVLLQQVKHFQMTIKNEDSILIDQYINDKEIIELAHRIHKSNRIVFLGNTTKCSYFNILIDYLLLNKKDARFLSHCFPKQVGIECSSLDENDLVVIVEPNYSFYEFSIRTDLSVDMELDLNRYPFHKAFIGKYSSSNTDIETVNIKKTNNIFITNIVMEYLVSRLLYHYIQISK